MRNSPEFPVCFIWKRFALNSSRFLSLTLTHKGSIQGILCTAEAQFSAHHTGCGSFPHVVHDGPPLSVSEHLHATLAQPGAGLQSHRLQRGNNGGNKPSDPHVKVMNTCVWLCLRNCTWLNVSYHSWMGGLGSSWGDASKLRSRHTLHYCMSPVLTRTGTTRDGQLSKALWQAVLSTQTVNLFYPESLFLWHEAQSGKKTNVCCDIFLKHPVTCF